MPVLNSELSQEDLWLNGGVASLILNQGTRCWWALSFTPRPLYSMYPLNSWAGWCHFIPRMSSYAHSTATIKCKQIFSHAWARRWVDSKVDVNVVAEKQICDTAGIRIPSFQPVDYYLAPYSKCKTNTRNLLIWCISI